MDGGEEAEVIRGPHRSGEWALARDRICYSLVRRQGPQNEYTIHVLDLASGRPTEVLRRVSASSCYWLAVSPDERWLLYTEEPEWQSELMLVENFR